MNNGLITWSNANWPGAVDGLRIEIWAGTTKIVDNDGLNQTQDSYPIDAPRGVTLRARITARFEAEYYEMAKDHTATVPALLNSSGGGVTIQEVEV